MGVPNPPGPSPWAVPVLTNDPHHQADQVVQMRIPTTGRPDTQGGAFERDGIRFSSSRPANLTLQILRHLGERSGAGMCREKGLAETWARWRFESGGVTEVAGRREKEDPSADCVIH